MRGRRHSAENGMRKNKKKKKNPLRRKFWTTAMSDYAMVGEDYVSDNMNEQDNTPAQAS